jgi:hypothetical protein
VTVIQRFGSGLQSRDDQVVVIHDETVNRTTNGSGPVTSHTLAVLQGRRPDASGRAGEADGMTVNFPDRLLAYLKSQGTSWCLPPGSDRATFSSPIRPASARLVGGRRMQSPVPAGEPPPARFSLYATRLKEASMPDDVIISADSHMTEPPDLWVERIDKQ